MRRRNPLMVVPENLVRRRGAGVRKDLGGVQSRFGVGVTGEVASPFSRRVNIPLIM